MLSLLLKVVSSMSVECDVLCVFVQQRVISSHVEDTVTITASK